MEEQIHGLPNLENRSKGIALKNTVYSCLWLEGQVKMKNNFYSSSAYIVIYLEIICKYYSMTPNPVNNSYKLFAIFKYWGSKFCWQKLGKKKKKVTGYIAVYILLN